MLPETCRLRQGTAQEFVAATLRPVATTRGN